MNKPLGKEARIMFATLWLVLAILTIFYLYRDFSGHALLAPQSPQNIPASTTELPTKSISPSETATIDPTWIDRTVDTSDWKMYSDSEYGIQFKYPPTWNASSTSYFKGAIVENPSDKRLYEDEGDIPFSILVYRTYGISGNTTATSTTDLDALGFKFTGLSGKYLNVKTFPSSEGRKVLFYSITHNTADEATGIIIENDVAYEVILTAADSVNKDGKSFSEDELDAFIGIFSTFKFTK